ncbi:hypothetical protein AJ78_06843 [Emergomyces pasteurianus Ep9510]|uniref:Uncharacterized protein n=1 Tax=Emergomyces pasteurianus Ep9510 TaxID=1447872 RepID=A0A1J9P937_9EURO|nr:hypothetical protein AJ78_06843 [Emergomyces pasteurianus Ep9510]
MAEASKDPSPITAQSEPNWPSPLPPPLANNSQSSHATPQLGTESQVVSEPPSANTDLTMRNIDSPVQQLPEEAVHSLPVPPPQHPSAPTASANSHTSTPMQSNPDEKRDVTMSGGEMVNDNQQQTQTQPQPQPTVPAASSTTAPAPSANTFNLNNSNNASTPPIPQIRPGGAPARVYMNEKIVPYLLEGMKTLAKEQPSNPLRALGEYLIQKSKEVEE